MTSVTATSVAVSGPALCSVSVNVIVLVPVNVVGDATFMSERSASGGSVVVVVDVVVLDDDVVLVVVGAASHVPPVHVPDSQTVPQFPQLFGSVDVSTHVPLHRCWPSEQQPMPLQWIADVQFC